MDEYNVLVMFTITDVIDKLNKENKINILNSVRYINYVDCVTGMWEDWLKYDSEHDVDLYELATEYWENIILENFATKKYTLQRRAELFTNKWNNGGGFMRNLCDTITKADRPNLKLLHKAYPKLVEGYVAYAHDTLYEEWEEKHA